ncbi:MAG: aminotransferase class III-fold pyridoxal phosphate-dependent enzyme, partial [Pedobacter sp.]
YGFTPDLTKLYLGQQRKFLHLPSYQFDKRPYWLDIPAKNVATTNIPTHATELPLQEEQINSLLMRKNKLTIKVKEIIEDASGIEMTHIGLDENYLAIGLDSLLLTQLAISLKREFSLPITFRKLNEEYPTIATLVAYLDENMPPEAIQETANVTTITPQVNEPSFNYNPQPQASASHYPDSALGLIAQQLEILSKQVMLMQGGAQNYPSQAPAVNPSNVSLSPKPEPTARIADADLSPEEKTEIQKPFGATPKIEKIVTTLHEKQEKFLMDLTVQYNKKTAKSKAYTGESRSYMADPRVVSGFKPVTKELVYPIVINKSKGSRLWDLDGNEYIDALNGFGSNMLGYQPDVIKNAMHNQI